jgi:outer membrane immunogenic protein
MKRLFLGSVALVALGLAAPAAFAAERPVPAPAYAPPPPPAPVYTWSGCYIGASAGYSGGHTDGVTTTAASRLTLATGGTAVVPGGQQIRGPFELSGFIGGGQLGCNWQWGAWVFGIEGDGSATNKSGQTGPVPGIVVTSVGSVVENPTSFAELQERWLVTARGKLGWTVWDKTMVYVTGGGAWAKIDYSKWSNSSGTVSPITTGFQQSDTRTGWTVGVGAEYALGYGWSVKAEYLYVDFGDWTTATTCSGLGSGCPTAAGSVTSVQVNSFHDHIVRAGMNYKFW